MRKCKKCTILVAGGLCGSGRVIPFFHGPATRVLATNPVPPGCPSDPTRLLALLQDPAPAVVPADTAWMLVSTALVLLMTPALAFFYGGLVRSKNSLNTMMMSFVALGVVGIVWALAGVQSGVQRGKRVDRRHRPIALLGGVGTEAKGTIPHVLFMAYQGTFAIITAALISGAVVERMRFGPYLAFIALWTLLVYAPVAHWVWGGGWLMSRGVLDFAGGTVVHINAGISALVAAIVLGSRKDYSRQAILPTTCPSCSLARACSGSAGSASTAAARWPPTSWPHSPSPTRSWRRWPRWSSGCCSTTSGPVAPPPSAAPPASWWVSSPSLRPPDSSVPPGALLLGGIAAFPSYFAIVYRSRTRLDDSLDVFAGHGIGGMTGALLTGVFAQKALERRRRRWAAGRQRGAARHSGARRRNVARLRGRHDLRHPQGARSASPSLRAVPKTEGVGHGREPARRRGVHHRRRLHPRHARCLAAAGSPVAAFHPHPASR